MIQNSKNKFVYLSLFSIVVLFSVLLFVLWQLKNKSETLNEKLTNMKKLNTELLRVKSELDEKDKEIKKKDELIEAQKILIASIRKNSENLEKRYSGMLNAVNEAAKSVEQYKKRAEADEMLLAKYSKVFFLNEHYAPEHISFINSEYTDKSLRFKSEALPFLSAMLDDMKKAGLNPKIISAYRSFDQQKNLKGKYLQVYGSGANKFSADQGYSEHQLGTTVDIINKGGVLNTDFENSEEFKWLKKNAWRYGFIMSYPKNNSYYMYEPWHWRFVGVELAKYLHDNNLNFYDLSQNKINTYLIDIFDKKPIKAK